MTKKVIFFSILGSAFVTATTAFAAIPPQSKKALSSSAILRGGGAIHGGIAGKGFSLIGIQSFPSKNQKLERLTVSIGDPLFQTHQGAPGYFHIENKTDTRQVVINFAQTYNTKFDENTLRQSLSKSPFVQNSQILFEPESQSMSLVLTLKKGASIRARPIAGRGQNTAQLNIDLFEDSLLNAPAKQQVSNAAARKPSAQVTRKLPSKQIVAPEPQKNKK